MRARCRRCAMGFALVGPRLTSDALATLRDHVRAAHPRQGLPAEAQAGAILAHFDVERVP